MIWPITEILYHDHRSSRSSDWLGWRKVDVWPYTQTSVFLTQYLCFIFVANFLDYHVKFNLIATISSTLLYSWHHFSIIQSNILTTTCD